MKKLHPEPRSLIGKEGKLATEADLPMAVVLQLLEEGIQVLRRRLILPESQVRSKILQGGKVGDLRRLDGMQRGAGKQ